MTGRGQIPASKAKTADRNVFVSTLKNLERGISNALRNDPRYLDRFRNFESKLEPVFRKVISFAPEGELAELRAVREMFRGFDGLGDTEKAGVLSASAGRINAVLSKFKTEAAPAPAAGSPPALDSPVDRLRGVGPAFASFLAKKSVFTVRDALLYFPFRYEDRRNIKPVSQAEPNVWQTVRGRIDFAGRTRGGRGAQYRVTLKEGGGSLDLVWFHFDDRYMRGKYGTGKLVIVSGEVGVDPRRGTLQILHPAADRVEVLGREDEAEGSIHIDRIVPVYPLTEGLGQRRLRSVMKTVAEQTGLLDGIMPDGCADGLVPLPDAVAEMHFPDGAGGCPDFSRGAWEAGGRDRNLPAPRTVAFFEFLLLRLAIEMRKNTRSAAGGIEFGSDGGMCERFARATPFELTASQKEAVSLIRERMESPDRMNVLLQGDVGSGKTVVALQAIMKALDSGYQAALMAPTQVLAEQHARLIMRHTKGMGIKTAVLKGGDSGADFESAASGGAGIVVGTHALIYDRVKFKRLGLAVVDEQHKFGVAQREKLTSKGLSPDILVMTATPIPRSLAMTVYGDLEVVSIKGLPGGRKPVETSVTGKSPRDRRGMLDAIKSETEQGGQCYFICPLIDADSEGDEDASGVFEAASDLRKDLPGARVSVLHGRMPPEEKDRVMNEFQNGSVDVLVSTTVVEVGVDVPNAALIVIDNADRFGISQLHQLRGRVGRGSRQSRCILLKSSGISDEGARRLDVLAETPDGFSIAETDLRMRGPGEFLGTKQSGAANFRFADLVMDSEVLSLAHNSAKEMLKNDPELKNSPVLKEMALEAAQPLEAVQPLETAQPSIKSD